MRGRLRKNKKGDHPDQLRPPPRTGCALSKITSGRQVLLYVYQRVLKQLKIFGLVLIFLKIFQNTKRKFCYKRSVTVFHEKFGILQKSLKVFTLFCFAYFFLFPRSAWEHPLNASRPLVLRNDKGSLQWVGTQSILTNVPTQSVGTSKHSSIKV